MKRHKVHRMCGRRAAERVVDRALAGVVLKGAAAAREVVVWVVA